MDMSGERHIPAPRQKVWEALNDPEVLRGCIPGCETLERTAEHDMKATATIKIGPISARFNGNIHLTDIDAPNSYRISGEGQGGVAGFAKGGANVRLSDDGPFTLLSYDVKAQVGGKIAQLGARLIDATSKQMADLFFDRFTAEVSGPQEVAATGPIVGPTLAAESATDTADAGVSTPLAQTARPKAAPALLGMLSRIPEQPFGLPRVAIIGIVLYVPVFILIFKSYVFG